MNIYVSHPIRGLNRNATPRNMHLNNMRACIFGATLRIRYPGHVFYVPAEHEEFVGLSYTGGYLSEDQILALDCCILKTKDGIIFYNHEGEFSSGMEVEDACRMSNGIPAAVVSTVSEVITLPELKNLLK